MNGAAVDGRDHKEKRALFMAWVAIVAKNEVTSQIQRDHPNACHQTGKTRKLRSERDDGKVTTGWILGSHANDARAVHAWLGLSGLCKG